MPSKDNESPFAGLSAEIAADIASSLVPGSGAAVKRLADSVRSERARRNSRCLRAAEHISGLSREDLAERVVDNPELVPLVTRVLFHAGMTGDDKRLDAMGAMFGRAAQDPTEVNVCEEVLTGITFLRPQDVAVLRQVRGLSVLAGAQGDDHSPPDDDVRYTTRLGRELDMPKEYIEAALVRLCNGGFLTAFHGVFGGGSKYDMSELGYLLFDVLERLDDLDADNG